MGDVFLGYRVIGSLVYSFISLLVHRVIGSLGLLGYWAIAEMNKTFLETNK